MVVTSHKGCWRDEMWLVLLKMYIFYFISIRLNVIIKNYMWLVVNTVIEDGFWKAETFSSPKVSKKQSIFYTNQWKNQSKIINSCIPFMLWRWFDYSENHKA